MRSRKWEAEDQIYSWLRRLLSEQTGISKMQDKKIIRDKRQAGGLSLIELMIAVVLGLLIMAAVTAMTVNNLKISGDTLKSARLNQDLGAVMQIMVNDIRRAGYAGDAAGYKHGIAMGISISYHRVAYFTATTGQMLILMILR